MWFAGDLPVGLGWAAQAAAWGCELASQQTIV